MARIQSKTSGRKPPSTRGQIDPREMRRKAEEALVEKGVPSKRWGQYQENPKKLRVER